MQLPQLRIAYRSRCVHHQINRLGRLRKGNHLTQARRARKNHHKPVQTQRDSTMRGRPILQSLKKESKTILGLLIRPTQRMEDLLLPILPMNTDRTGTQLRPV